MKRKLGDEIAGVVAEFGDRTRVEVSGVLLLRSMCRLTHKGHQQYAKGDGHAFHDYLSREWPNLKNRCVGRAEHSIRQDWICEASWKFHNLIPAIVGYTVSTLLLGPNILRDSILTRLENMHFEAYVHTCAILWISVFQELRGLTNTTAMLNPMELNDLYDHLWNVGVLLEDDNNLTILDDEFRPWPRVRYNELVSRQFYDNLERDKAAEKAELRQYLTREDVTVYQPILQEVLHLFGIAIHTSLERTMGKYLKATDGVFRNDLRDDWELQKVSQLLCTNNAAERPFGVAKAYMKIYQTLSLRTLASFSLSMCNGSHRPAESKGKQLRTSNKAGRCNGTALNAAQELREAITTLCSVKRVNVGKVTAKLDNIFVTNTARAAARRETKRLEEEEAATRKIAKKAVKFNNALEEPLAATVGDMLAHLKAMGNAVGVSKDYLKRQLNARLMRAENDGYTYPSIGAKYRTQSKKKKIKMMSNDSQSEVDYLQELVVLMLKADSRRGAVDSEAVALSGLLRAVPTLNVLSTNAKALKLRQQMEDRLCQNAQQTDDPWLLFLSKEYIGKICFLDDIAERHKLYRVANIAYWTSTKTRYANWEATLEPIHLDSNGNFYVADEDVVLGPKGVRLTKAKVLLGYILAQYIDGDDAEPTRTECVDLYIENAMEKLKAYVFKLQQSKSSAKAT